MNKNTTLVFPFKISLKKGYIENLINTLNNLGAKKRSFPNDKRVSEDYTSVEWMIDFRNKNRNDCWRPNKILIIDTNKYKGVFCIPIKKDYKEFEYGEGSNKYPLLSETKIRTNIRRNDIWHSIKINLYDKNKSLILSDLIKYKYANYCKDCNRRGKLVNFLPPWHPRHTLLGNNYASSYSGLYLKDEKYFYYIIPLEINELEVLSNISIEIINE